MPRCLGRWVEKEPGVYGVEWMGTLGKEDVVIKVLDESNGIGDAFLLNGDGPGMIDGAEAGCLPPSLSAQLERQVVGGGDRRGIE